jgi:peptidylprolyl isomerase
VKLRKLIIPTIAIAALMVLASCSSSENGGNDKTPSNADLYATQTAESSSTASMPTAAATQASVTPELSFAEACVNSGEKTFAAAPPRIIDTSKTYTATIKTDKGDIVLELFSDVPITTNNFVFLSCKGFYDGVTFHRVLQDFMAQGGDPLGTGTGGPGYAIPDEDDGDHTFADAGAISMAKSGPNTTGSQFFITYSPQTRLDADFTVFGKLTAGMDVLKQITLRDPDQNPTFTGDKIDTITITEQ